MRHLLLRAATCALCLTPAISHAYCMTPTDVDRGVRITFANGDVTTVRAMGGDVYEVEEIYDNQAAHFRYHAYLATYNFWWTQLRAGVEIAENAERVDWGVDVTALPAPAADAPTWTGTIRMMDPDGLVSDTATREIRYAAGTPLQIDGCSYEVVSVGMRSDWQSGGSPQVQIWSYLPENGLSFIVGWTNTGGEYLQTTVTAIEPM